ncbi:NAD(P)-binding domain-containing protein [Actinokineospora pegani]|uniref:NAD(P)-binding domain-containing protein n=1 Tax=Actinokineospora pegani TaxID=2654637 RepID=UPI0012EAE85E|nr:NAD(P)-binding domain-containing protein [Actinokineospora pegani]
MKRVCVIGAGSAGIATCQVLHARGIEFDCYEAGSGIGGNWRYQNDNGMSSGYRSLHINTSRKITEYRAYPMPSDYPPYPSHVQMLAYLESYVDHFGFRGSIAFRSEVTSVEPVTGGGWAVTVLDRDSGESTTTAYESVVVANGHHWDPRDPEPSFPGEDTFTGVRTHSHYYRTPDEYAGKRVLVLGFGNSASDIAVETSNVAERTFLTLRRGGYVFPKFMFGKPADDMINPVVTKMLPREVQRWIMWVLLRLSIGKVEDFGLPAPSHKLFNAHPTVSETLLPKLGHGDIAVKPNISHFDGGTVHFVDGSAEEIDAVVYCSGYKTSFPFLSESVVAPTDNEVSLFHRMVDPAHPGLYFIGLFQPLGSVTVLSETQSHWLADLLDGTAKLPSVRAMRKEISDYRERLRKRYVTSKRHTMQVDHYPYIAELAKARREGAKLAKAARAAEDKALGALPASSFEPESVSLRIAAAPELVWDLISDVTRTGEWSPECRRCFWRGGERGVGAKFIGVNRKGWVVWVTSNTVEKSERGRSFAFRTDTNGVRWGYELRPDGDGTVVTQTWDYSGQTAAQRARTASFATMALGGYAEHTRELRDGIRTTLERVKAAAEAVTPARAPEVDRTRLGADTPGGGKTTKAA